MYFVVSFLFPALKGVVTTTNLFNKEETAMTFSNLNRTDMINTLTKKEFDVLIIGGGITGAGIALDAAKTGYEDSTCGNAGFCKEEPPAVQPNWFTVG